MGPGFVRRLYQAPHRLSSGLCPNIVMDMATPDGAHFALPDHRRPRVAGQEEAALTKPPGAPAELRVFSNLAPELAATLVTVASDIALVLDDEGIIQSVALGSADAAAGAHDWVGRPWVDTVTGETRRKVEQLLQEAMSGVVSRKREVNHRSASGTDIPVAYSAVRLGEDGPVLAVGRDLRAIAAIQQRFIDAQREMEQAYWKRRGEESRYRQLFQVATDAVLVVDASTHRVIEANRAACEMFDAAPEALVGQPLDAGFDRSARKPLESLLVSVRSTGRASEIRARLLASRASASVSATPFRSHDDLMLLVRARIEDQSSPDDRADSALADLMERTPDAVLITDLSGRLMMANPAFLSLVGIEHEALARGRWLGDWLGRPGRGLAELLSDVQSHGILTRTATTVRGDRTEPTDVEVSAALLPEGDQECVGFTMRPLPASNGPLDAQSATLARSIVHVLAQLGQVPMNELMHQGAALIERSLLAAALERAGGDRQGAAELLGIRTTALSDGLRRHGLGGPAD